MLGPDLLKSSSSTQCRAHHVLVHPAIFSRKRNPVDSPSPGPAGAQGGDLADQFIDRRTRAKQVRSTLTRYPALSPSLVLLGAIVVFGLLNSRFLAPTNLSLITQQVAVVGAVAVAQTVIILTAGIDLSVGAAMILVSMVMASSTADAGVPVVLGLGLGLLAGLATGAFNGLLVTRFHLPPFIVTLGTLSVFTAMTLLYTNGTVISGQSMPATLTWTGTSFGIFGVQVTYGVVMMLVICAAIAFLLGRTGWGRHVYAVGDNREAARLAGVRVNRVLVSVYLVAGAVLAMAAWIQIGRSNAASPNAGIDLNLDSITAVVIGGTSLFGGRGLIWGSLLGALIVGVFRNGLSLLGLDVLWQTLAVGLLIIVAVIVDQWIRQART